MASTGLPGRDTDAPFSSVCASRVDTPTSECLKTLWFFEARIMWWARTCWGEECRPVRGWEITGVEEDRFVCVRGYGKDIRLRPDPRVEHVLTRLTVATIARSSR